MQCDAYHKIMYAATRDKNHFCFFNHLHLQKNFFNQNHLKIK